MENKDQVVQEIEGYLKKVQPDHISGQKGLRTSSVLRGFDNLQWLPGVHRRHEEGESKPIFLVTWGHLAARISANGPGRLQEQPRRF